MRCKTKQRKGSRPDPPRRLSGSILGYRRITVLSRRSMTAEASSGVPQRRDEINDHPPEEIRETEFGLLPSKYEGRFRKRRRPSLFDQLIETKITPAVMRKAPSASRRVNFSFKTKAAIALMMMTLKPWNG